MKFRFKFTWCSNLYCGCFIYSTWRKMCFVLCFYWTLQFDFEKVQSCFTLWHPTWTAYVTPNRNICILRFVTCQLQEPSIRYHSCFVSSGVKAGDNTWIDGQSIIIPCTLHSLYSLFTCSFNLRFICYGLSGLSGGLKFPFCFMLYEVHPYKCAFVIDLMLIIWFEMQKGICKVAHVFQNVYGDIWECPGMVGNLHVCVALATYYIYILHTIYYICHSSGQS